MKLVNFLLAVTFSAYATLLTHTIVIKNNLYK